LHADVLVGVRLEVHRQVRPHVHTVAARSALYQTLARAGVPRPQDPYRAASPPRRCAAAVRVGLLPMTAPGCGCAPKLLHAHGPLPETRRFRLPLQGLGGTSAGPSNLLIICPCSGYDKALHT